MKHVAVQTQKPPPEVGSHTQETSSLQSNPIEKVISSQVKSSIPSANIIEKVISPQVHTQETSSLQSNPIEKVISSQVKSSIPSANIIEKVISPQVHTQETSSLQSNPIEEVISSQVKSSIPSANIIEEVISPHVQSTIQYRSKSPIPRDIQTYFSRCQCVNGICECKMSEEETVFSIQLLENTSQVNKDLSIELLHDIIENYYGFDYAYGVIYLFMSLLYYNIDLIQQPTALSQWIDYYKKDIEFRTKEECIYLETQISQNNFNYENLFTFLTLLSNESLQLTGKTQAGRQQNIFYHNKRHCVHFSVIILFYLAEKFKISSINQLIQEKFKFEKTTNFNSLHKKLRHNYKERMRNLKT